MSEVKYVEHNGKQILLMEFAKDNGTGGIAETGEEAMRIVRSAGEPKSIRGLIDLTGTPLNAIMRETMKKMSKNNGPYMKSVAFVGMGMILTPFLKAMLSLTGRTNHRVFTTMNGALDWLSRD